MTRHHLPHRISARPGREGGFSLLVVLIFLIVLSLLAVFAVRGVVTSDRMAGNAQDWNLAFQAAEAALRDGEADVSGTLAPEAGGGAITVHPTSPAAFTADCTNGLCLPATAVGNPPVWSVAAHSPLQNDNGWKSGATIGAGPSIQYGFYTGATALPDPAKTDAPLPYQPRYIIETLGSPVAGSSGGSPVVGGGYASAGGGNAGASAINAYRVTAVGFGKIVTSSGVPATRVVLQSTISR